MKIRLRKIIIRVIALLLISIMVFDNSGYVFATELSEAITKNREKLEKQKIEENTKQKQELLYEQYFGEKQSISLSGNEQLFKQETIAEAEDKFVENEMKNTEACRDPFFEEDFEKDKPVHVGCFEKTYQTSENQYKTVFTTYPNTYLKDGTEKIIDNTLIKETEANKTTEKSISQNAIEHTESYTNAESYIDTVIKGNNEELQLQMSMEDTTLEMYSDKGNFSKESVSENAIRYNDVYENVDIQYTITNAGVKEDIILLTKDSRNTFYYTLKKDGIYAEKHGDNINVYKEENDICDDEVCIDGVSSNTVRNNTVSHNDISENTKIPFAVISAPKMEDAVGAVSKEIKMELTEKEDEYIITIAPDTEWLNSKDRIYPVMIDPTTTIQSEIMDYTVMSGGGFIAGESKHYTGNLGVFGTARYYLITGFMYQSIFDLAGSNHVEILDATLRLVQTNDSNDSVIGCYRNMEQIPVDNPSFDTVAAIDRKIARENATSPSGYGVHIFDVKDAVNGWMNSIYPSHGFVFILDNETKEGVRIAGIGAENIEERPSLTINWQVAGDVSIDYPLDDTTINLRPMVKSDISGALQCYGVFADGIANPRSIVTYDLSDTSKKFGQSILISNQKIYPNSSAFDSAFPSGTVRYADSKSNWQTIVPFTEFSYDTLYNMNVKASYNGKTGKTTNSDNFLIYKVSRYDTMKKIADHYGVSLSDLLFDNKAPDMLLVENNTLFIKNPTKNQNNPYQPTDLTDEEKAQIDRSLLGRARHCEYGFEPINLSTGNYYLSQEDLHYSDSFGTFSVIRSYNSLNPTRIGSFGRGFTSFLDENIAKNASGDIYYNREDGSTLLFSKQGDGSYKVEEGNDLKLITKQVGEKIVTLSTGETRVPINIYQIEREDGSQVTFDESGVLVEIAEKNGAIMQIMHDNTSGNVIGFMRESAYFAVETNARGSVKKITAPDGSVMSYGYDAEDNLITVKNPLGYEKRFVYDSNHLMLSWYNENNIAIVQNTYDVMGRVVKQLDEGGIAHTLSYEPGKTITTDGNGNRTEYYYDSQGRTTQILYADGSKETKTYQNGYLSSETDAAGNLTTYSYNENGKITEKKIEDKKWTYSYDNYGNIIKTVDPLGNISTGIFNEKDLVTKTVDGDGREELYTYDSRGRLISYTDSDGLKTVYTYQNNQLYSKSIGNNLIATYAYNRMGDLTEEKDALGHTMQYAYDSLHHCIAKKNKNGIQTTYTFFPNGLLKSATDGKNHTVTYDYDVYGNIEKITRPDGTVNLYTYDAEGNMLSQTDSKGNMKTFSYDNRNRLIKSTDESGYIVYFEYDNMGNLIKKRDDKGSLLEADYDTVWGLPVCETDAMGHKTVYDYDSMGNLLRVYYEDELQFSYEYDASMRRVKETFANGLSYSYLFDARNNLISKKDSNGYIEKTEYNVFCEPIKEISKSGRTTAYTYDACGNLLSQTDALGYVTEYVCDNAGNVLKVTDGNGNSTEYTYDACGNITTLKRADGSVLQYAYDENENLTAYKDGNDKITTYSYDKNGNRVLVTDALGYTTAFAYNEANYLIETTDALNNKTKIEYDYAGNIRKVTDGNGADITFTYDRNQNLLSETDENGHTVTYLYDAFGRISRKKDALGNETTYSYDSVGNLIKTTDALGKETNYAYDIYGNLIKKTNALAEETTYTYNREGELLKVTDAKDCSVSYKYDAAGNLVKEIDALGNMKSYSYDAIGNLIEECNTLGNKTEYFYDSVYNLIRTTGADGNSTKLAYDNENHVIEVSDAKENKTIYDYDALGRLIKITDAEGYEEYTAYDALSRVLAEKKGDSLYQYTYDATGNLITETDPLENTISYVYDKAGNLIKKKTADGSEWIYGYDAENQVTNYTDGDGKETTYTYDALKRLREIANVNGTYLKYDYDAVSNVISTTDGKGATTHFVYDATGNLVKEENAEGISTTFSYDKAGRLVKKIYANKAEETYEYDSEGNLLKLTDVTGLVTTYDYDVMGRLIKETQTADGKSHSNSYEYDENGNLLKKTDPLDYETKYKYDTNNRLIEVISPLNHETSYTYTELDNIASVKDASGTVYHFTYDKKGRVLTESVDNENIRSYEYDALDRVAGVQSGESKAIYYYGATNLLKTERNGEEEQYRYNAVGELEKKIDSLQNEISYSYDNVGNLTQKTDENGTTIRYTYDALNQLTDIDSGEEQSSAKYSYDDMGNLVYVEDVTGKSTYTYDLAGRLIQSVDGSGQRVGYSYDGFGNLSMIMYPDGSVVRYEYDDNNRLSNVSSETGKVTYDYDAEGNVIKITRENGYTIISYDELNRVKNLVNTCDGTVISAYGYAYDKRSNITKEIILFYADGKETKKENSYKYDVLGELIECKSIENNKETVVKYSYDPNGNRIKMDTTSPEERQTVSYRYDHERLVYEEEKTNDVITRVTEKSYDKAGNLVKEIIRESGTNQDQETVITSEEESNSTERYYSYDAKGRLSAIADKERLLFAALYDGGDNRVFTLEYDQKIKEVEKEEPADVWDENSRIEENTAKIIPSDNPAEADQTKIPQDKEETKPDMESQPEQKRPEMSENAQETPVTREEKPESEEKNAFLFGVLMEAASFLPISTPVKQWIQKHVDFYLSCAIVKEKATESGAQGTGCYFEDLESVDYESGFTAFDAINEAIRENTGTGLDKEDYQKISYVNDINRTNEEVLYETVAGGNGANGSFSYHYGLQRENYSYEGVTTTSGYTAFDAVKTGQTGTYYYDGYGSVSNLAAGKDSLSYVYDAYGNIQKLGMYKDVSTDSAAYASPYGYNGEYSHALSGLQYLRARYYNAESGSFISKDSYAGNIRSILSANRYTYGENNPLGYADPSGHSILSKIKNTATSIKNSISNAVTSVKNTVKNAATAVKNFVSDRYNSIKSVRQTIFNAEAPVHTARYAGETNSQYQNRVAQEKARKSSAKADIISTPLNLYESTKGWLNRTVENYVSAVDSSIFGSAVYTASNAICEVERATCKGFQYCFNYVQEKIPDKDLSRILKGVGLIALGSGKITGAVGLAVISAPFCVAGIGVGGEIAAGIVSASGGGDIAQGIYEIAYGWNGDSESKSFNLVRDTLYSGNEKAYHVSTGTAAACGQVGQGIAAMEAAKKAAEKELAEQMAKEAAKESKEVVKKNADDVIEEAAEAAGKNLDDIAKDSGKVLNEGGTPSGYYQDANGRWHRPNGQFASNAEVGITSPAEVSTGSHGNSLSDPRTNYGYVLVDRNTNEILKFGESLNPKNRYSQNYLNDNNAKMIILEQGSKADIHYWQIDMNNYYKYKYGEYPPLNVGGN